MTELSEGDRIRIKKKTETGVVVYEGIVMPTGSGKETIVIKLDTGYNIGIRPGNAEIEVISSAEALKTERTEEKEIPCDCARVRCEVSWDNPKPEKRSD